VKAGMVRAGVDKVGHTQLLDAAQALVIPMLYQRKYQIVRYLNKPINGVVYDFILFQLCKGNTYNSPFIPHPCPSPKERGGLKQKAPPDNSERAFFIVIPHLMLDLFQFNYLTSFFTSS
jgi:hypothetical protein